MKKRQFMIAVKKCRNLVKIVLKNLNLCYTYLV